MEAACGMYVVGTVDTFRVLHDSKQVTYYCIPDNVTNGQLVDVGMPGIVVLIVARGSGPRPFAPYEVHYLVYEPLQSWRGPCLPDCADTTAPGRQSAASRLLRLRLGNAQLDNGGYSLFIWPQEFQGRFATGGVPVPVPGGAACFSGWNIRAWEIERPPRD